jgi:hypothetical protein
MELEVREFATDDVLLIRLNDMHLQNLIENPLTESHVSRLISLVNKGEARTIWVGGEILCICGYVNLHPGCVEVYTYMSQNVTLYPKQLLKGMREVLKECDEFARVQTSVVADSDVSVRFIERLGFEREGLMRKYIHGIDYYRYARVK